MSDVIYVIAKLPAQPGKEEALKALIQPLIEPTRREKGCLCYLVLEDRRDPALVTLYEEWESEADLDTHLAHPTIRRVFDQFPELLLAGKADITRYKKIG
jgi:quinol monooxygenase YgiN